MASILCTRLTVSLLITITEVSYEYIRKVSYFGRPRIVTGAKLSEALFADLEMSNSKIGRNESEISMLLWMAVHQARDVEVGGRRYCSRRAVAFRFVLDGAA